MYVCVCITKLKWESGQKTKSHKKKTSKIIFPFFYWAERIWKSEVIVYLIPFTFYTNVRRKLKGMLQRWGWSRRRGNILLLFINRNLRVKKFQILWNSKYSNALFLDVIFLFFLYFNVYLFYSLCLVHYTHMQTHTPPTPHTRVSTHVLPASMIAYY